MSCQIMAATVISFRWLDLLEKEFDKSFVDLDTILGSEVGDDEDEDLTVVAKLKMETLASCFAQLSHKAQTIFQLNAKLEAEMLNLRHELTESEAVCDVIKDENQEMLTKIHTVQLEVHKHSTDTNDLHDLNCIQHRLEEDLKHQRESRLSVEIPRKEIVFLQRENDSLRKQMISLQGELCGAKITAKYLDKELAGRIQQLQLMRNGINGDQHERVWKQLESEIQLHRHKTVVRACRKNVLSGQVVKSPYINGAHVARPTKHEYRRCITLKRFGDEDIGLSVTGGKDHGIPILISAIHSPSLASASKQLFVGDALLSVNGMSLRDLSHSEAVLTLSSQKGDLTLEVLFVLPEEEEEDDGSLTDDQFAHRFKMFDDDVTSLTSSIMSVPNGRLSRASIDSIRGSTENIVASSRVNSDFEDDPSSPLVPAGELPNQTTNQNSDFNPCGNTSNKKAALNFQDSVENPLGVMVSSQNSVINMSNKVSGKCLPDNIFGDEELCADKVASSVNLDGSTTVGRLTQPAVHPTVHGRNESTKNIVPVDEVLSRKVPIPATRPNILVEFDHLSSDSATNMSSLESRTHPDKSESILFNGSY